MTTVSMHHARTRLSDLVARAEAGEEIVIARRDVPAVRLVPVGAGGGAMGKPGGFGEDSQAEFDIKGLRQALEAGREFTIMRDGKPVATVAPTMKKKRVPGRLKGLVTLPESFFDPLPEDER